MERAERLTQVAGSFFVRCLLCSVYMTLFNGLREHSRQHRTAQNTAGRDRQTALKHPIQHSYTAPQKYRLKLYGIGNMRDNADYIAPKSTPLVSDFDESQILFYLVPLTSTPNDSKIITIRQFSKFSESGHVDTPSRRHPILYDLSSS